MQSWSLSGKPCPPQATAGCSLSTIEFKGSPTPVLNIQMCCDDGAQVRLDVAHLRLMSRPPAKGCTIIGKPNLL